MLYGVRCMNEQQNGSVRPWQKVNRVRSKVLLRRRLSSGYKRKVICNDPPPLELSLPPRYVCHYVDSSSSASFLKLLHRDADHPTRRPKYQAGLWSRSTRVRCVRRRKRDRFLLLT